MMHEQNVISADMNIRHFTAAMMACIAGDLCHLVEWLISMYIQQGGRPDAVMCTQWLRALLQQGKWDEAQSLLERMKASGEFTQPSSQRYSWLLHYQVSLR